MVCKIILNFIKNISLCVDECLHGAKEVDNREGQIEDDPGRYYF